MNASSSLVWHISKNSPFHNFKILCIKYVMHFFWCNHSLCIFEVIDTPIAKSKYLQSAISRENKITDPKTPGTDHVIPIIVCNIIISNLFLHFEQILALSLMFGFLFPFVAFTINSNNIILIVYRY